MPSFHQPRPRPGFLIDTSGFALIGLIAGAGVSQAISALSASPPVRPPTVRVDAYEEFRVVK
jgi:hypothetical protein